MYHKICNQLSIYIVAWFAITTCIKGLVPAYVSYHRYQLFDIIVKFFDKFEMWDVHNSMVHSHSMYQRPQYSNKIDDKILDNF